MKVLIFIGSLDAGGAERVTTHLANAWAARGWEVTLITIAPQTLDFFPLDSEVKRRSLDLVGESANFFQAAWANARRLRALRRELRELRPDAILGMTTTAAVLAILASMGLGCRVIVSERTHPPMVSIGWLWTVLRRLSYPQAFRVVMLTIEGLRWLESHIPNAKGVVIPNSAVFPLLAGEPLLPPARFITPERKLLLAIGRMVEEKQFDRLIETFGALASRHPLWDLVILGEGPERSRLEQQVAVLRLQQRVSLPGRAGNIGDWCHRADLYVMSSRFEGFPNTLTEAMAYGLPVVSFDCDTGPGDIIRQEVDGLLVPPGDMAGLISALDRLMGDEVLRRRFAVRAIDVRERFSMRKIAGMWESLFVEAQK